LPQTFSILTLRASCHLCCINSCFLYVSCTTDAPVVLGCLLRCLANACKPVSCVGRRGVCVCVVLIYTVLFWASYMPLMV
jgi:hypothetical protein